MTENACVEQLQDDLDNLKKRKEAISWALDLLSDYVPEYRNDETNPEFNREAWDDLEDYECFLSERINWFTNAIAEENSMRHRDGLLKPNEDLAYRM